MFNSFEHIIIFILILTISLLLIPIIILCINYVKMKNTLTDYTHFMYQLMRKIESVDSNTDKIAQSTNTTNETLNTLTSSIRSVIRKLAEENNTKIMPGPQLMELIDKCITEHVLMEAKLTQNQVVKDKVMNTIAGFITETFPHVNEEYIVRRVTYIIEEFISSNTGRKSK